MTRMDTDTTSSDPSSRHGIARVVSTALAAVLLVCAILGVSFSLLLTPYPTKLATQLFSEEEGTGLTHDECAQVGQGVLAFCMGDDDVNRLLEDPAIIRNRRKIAGALGNARAFLEVQEHFGSFARYMWSFVENEPRQNAWTRPEDLPTTTPEAERFSADLKRRGFTFVGPTVCYAHMQAVGMVNDHLVTCFRHAGVARRSGPFLL